MGTSISGPLAILYMDNVERKFLRLNPPLTIYARYVDDLFILTKNEEEANHIFNTINTIDNHITSQLNIPTKIMNWPY